MNILHLIILGIWLMLPAYVPNPAAALFGGGRPIDLGKKLKDGYRIFGDGKTFRGLISGTLCGIAIGLMQNIIAPRMGLPSFVLPTLSTSVYIIKLMETLFCLSFGALLGDLCKSFFKRRFGLRRGASLPVVDQLDLVFGSWLLCLIFVREWFLYNFNVQIIVIVLVMTPLLHISMNIIGYKMGVKKEPW